SPGIPERMLNPLVPMDPNLPRALAPMPDLLRLNPKPWPRLMRRWKRNPIVAPFRLGSAADLGDIHNLAALERQIDLLAVQVILPPLTDGAAEGVLQLHDAVGLASGLLDDRARGVADGHDAAIESHAEVGERAGAGQRQQDCEDDAHGGFPPVWCEPTPAAAGVPRKSSRVRLPIAL